MACSQLQPERGDRTRCFNRGSTSHALFRRSALYSLSDRHRGCPIGDRQQTPAKQGARGGFRDTIGVW
ncbi:MAG: hypothetical protein U7126_14060 [Microcoleus sp.]